MIDLITSSEIAFISGWGSLVCVLVAGFRGSFSMVVISRHRNVTWISCLKLSASPGEALRGLSEIRKQILVFQKHYTTCFLFLYLFPAVVYIAHYLCVFVKLINDKLCLQYFILVLSERISSSNFQKSRWGISSLYWVLDIGVFVIISSNKINKGR